MMVSKEDVRRVMDEVEALRLGDGAHWMLVHERLRLPYGKVFDIIGADPEFFGYAPAPPRGRRLPPSRQHRIRSRDDRRMDDAVPIASYPGPMTTETAPPLVQHTPHHSTPAPDHFSGGGGSSGGAGASGSWDSSPSDSGSSSSDSGGGSSDGGGGGGE